MANQAPPPSYVIAAGAIWPPVCVAFVGLRFYARRKQRSKLLWDDWFVIPALFLTTGMGAALISGVALKSLAYPTPKTPGANPLAASNFEIRTTRTILWAFELMQIPALGLVKLSFVFFYRRIFCFPGSHRTFNILTWATICLIALWTISMWFTLFFSCGTNFKSYWYSVFSVKTNCVKTLDYENAFAASDTITDWIVFILPMPHLWELHMSFGRKISVILIFGLGALTIAASMTRMIIFIKSVKVDFLPTTDNDLIITGGLYWSMIESGLGLCVCCLPSLVGIFKATIWESIAGTIRKFSSNALHSTTTVSWRYKTGQHRVHSNTASLEQIVPEILVPKGAVLESHVMRSLSKTIGDDYPYSTSNGIKVTNSFSQSDMQTV